MDTCKCGHKKHEHKALRQVLWPGDSGPEVRFRGECYKCNCCLYVDSRQQDLFEVEIQ